MSTIKNVRNDNYFNAMNFVKQTISVDDIKMIEIIVKINFNFRATKYQKIKQTKFKISFETFKIFERFKKFV